MSLLSFKPYLLLRSFSPKCSPVDSNAVVVKIFHSLNGLRKLVLALAVEISQSFSTGSYYLPEEASRSLCNAWLPKLAPKPGSLTHQAETVFQNLAEHLCIRYLFGRIDQGVAGVSRPLLHAIGKDANLRI